MGRAQAVPLVSPSSVTHDAASATPTCAACFQPSGAALPLCAWRTGPRCVRPRSRDTDAAPVPERAQGARGADVGGVAAPSPTAPRLNSCWTRMRSSACHSVRCRRLTGARRRSAADLMRGITDPLPQRGAGACVRVGVDAHALGPAVVLALARAFASALAVHGAVDASAGAVAHQPAYGARPRRPLPRPSAPSTCVPTTVARGGAEPGSSANARSLLAAASRHAVAAGAPGCDACAAGRRASRAVASAAASIAAAAAAGKAAARASASARRRRHRPAAAARVAATTARRTSACARDAPRAPLPASRVRHAEHGIPCRSRGASIAGGASGAVAALRAPGW